MTTEANRNPMQTGTTPRQPCGHAAPTHTVEIQHQRCGHTASWQFSGPNLTPQLAAAIATSLGRKRACPVCQDPDEALVS